jgi:hypothetical protein
MYLFEFIVFGVLCLPADGFLDGFLLRCQMKSSPIFSLCLKFLVNAQKGPVRIVPRLSASRIFVPPFYLLVSFYI